MNRELYRFLRQNSIDIWRLVPILLIWKVPIPFSGSIIPFLVITYPHLLPSTFKFVAQVRFQHLCSETVFNVSAAHSRPAARHYWKEAAALFGQSRTHRACRQACKLVGWCMKHPNALLTISLLDLIFLIMFVDMQIKMPISIETVHEIAKVFEDVPCATSGTVARLMRYSTELTN